MLEAKGPPTLIVLLGQGEGRWSKELLCCPKLLELVFKAGHDSAKVVNGGVVGVAVVHGWDFLVGQRAHPHTQIMMHAILQASDLKK